MGRICSFGTRIDGVERCAAEAVIIRGGRHTYAYCLFRFRLRTMRDQARVRGLYVPGYPEMIAAVPSDGRCPKCSAELLWHSGRSTPHPDVASLQHLRDGGIAIWCYRCNGLEGKLGDGLDAYLSQQPAGFLPCSRCGGVWPESHYQVHRTSKRGRHSKCLACRRAYAEANKDHLRDLRLAKYHEDIEASRAKGRQKYAANRERCIAYQKKYRDQKKGVSS